jgi:hypothetical protein
MDLRWLGDGATFVERPAVVTKIVSVATVKPWRIKSAAQADPYQQTALRDAGAEQLA